jgi:tetratricopeptide (TPR) repeat protein
MNNKTGVPEEKEIDFSSHISQTQTRPEASMTHFPSGTRFPFLRLAVTAAAVMIFQAGCEKPAPSKDAANGQLSPEATAQATVMQKGLDLLYRAGDASAAADTFRAVLTQNPTHYGARFQLAKALDLSGKPEEARPIWQAVLGAAQGIRDTATIRTAQERLAQPDTVSQAALMGIGLNLLYSKNDPAGAVAEFRKLLERNPTHYGAHYQLAKALDQAGRRDEARPYWEKMLTMAEAIKDKTTADTARARLQRKP